MMRAESATQEEYMNRRELMKTGVAATVAATGMMGTVSCGSLVGRKTLHERVASLDMNSYLKELDQCLAHIDGFTFDPHMQHGFFDEQGKAAARSLTLSSMFRDLPLEGQLHPGMQQRMFTQMQEMNNAVFGGGKLISDTGLATDPEVVAAIKGPDNPGLKFLERFDRHAAETKLSYHKRMRLRTIGIDAVDLMRRKSPEVAFHEAYGKVKQMHRTAELCGSVQSANERATLMRVGRHAYVNRQREIAEIVQYYDRQLIASGDPRFVAEQQNNPIPTPVNGATGTQMATAKPSCPTIENCDCQEHRKIAWDQGYVAGEAAAYKKATLQAKMENATHLVSAGAWTLGVSLTVAAVGATFAVVSPITTAIVSGTVGGILLIIGLVILSVGAARKHRLKSHLRLA